MSIELSSEFRRNDRIVHRSLKDGAVLLNLNDGSYFEINPVGLAIWEALDGRSVREVVEVIRERFDDAPDSVEEDVLAYVGGLLDGGLIHPAE